MPTRRLLLPLAAALMLLAAAAAGAEPAPEIARDGLRWFNVAAPIPLASLRGRVVILDFWTEGCVNCLQVIPTLRRIEARFPDRVAVIGVHSPKFPGERDEASVADAIRRYDIRHPVVHDPALSIWQAYQVQGWPTLAVLGPDGSLVGQLAGEPDPDQALRAIGSLVDQAAAGDAAPPPALPLRPEAQPAGRFRFPGKLKPVPGAEPRWALADGGHHQIVLLDDQGRELRRFGSGAEGRADGPAGSASFAAPQGLAATAAAIFVADTGNHLVRRIDLGSGAVTTLAGTGRRGPPLAGPAPALATALASPWDLAAGDGVLYLANAGTHQLAELALQAGTIRRLAGNGEEGLADGPAERAPMAQPSGLALSADGGSLYVADAESSAIRRVALGAQPALATLVGAGLFDFGRVNGRLADARLQHPLGLALAGDSILVADTYNGAIRRIDPGPGQVAELDGGDFTCIDPLCIPDRQPAGVVAAGPDRVLVVDSGNHRVEEYRLAARTYRTWAE